MAIDHGHGADAGRNPSVNYDRSDLGARGILIFFIGLAVFAVLMHVVVLGMYAGMTKFSEKHEPEGSPLAPQTYTPAAGILTNTANVNVEQFPQPRLSTHLSQTGMGPRSQPGAMTKLLLREAAVLTAKPWQDADGNVRLPIDQAMKAVLPRLPSRAGGVALPNYPGTGRQISYPSVQPESVESMATSSETTIPEGEGSGERPSTEHSAPGH